MSIILDFENATSQATPDAQTFEQWVIAALGERYEHAELSMRIVGEEEMTELNNQFRGQEKPTNVLSFPAELPEGLDIPLLGDIAICAPIVEREAIEQHKPITSHYAHMTVHGSLHLAGYDHIDDREAEEMEALEITILSQLGFENPYERNQ
jgi:probable rRNA maturation factor